jgi:hypothetical protein
MISKEFFDLMDATYQRLLDLSESKGMEYAGSADRLSNFKRLGVELSMPPEKVLWVYMTKHLDSLRTWLRELEGPIRRIPSEPIEGRIDDAILYLILLKGLICERTNRENLPAAGNNLPEAGGVRSAADSPLKLPTRAGLGGVRNGEAQLDRIEMDAIDTDPVKTPVWQRVVPDEGSRTVAAEPRSQGR